MIGPLDERVPAPIENPIERGYVIRETRVRVHQARFRGRALPAYHSQCAICRLKEVRLLDAAHIVADIEPQGQPSISNGLSLCSIHHRAFDHHLVGISPDYRVEVSRRLLEDEDGPMLDLLEGLPWPAYPAPKAGDVAPRSRAPRGTLRAVRRLRRGSLSRICIVRPRG